VLALVSRIYGLSARERELVALLIGGLDTREIATRMFVCRYTVNDHLGSVFAKLGILSRRELIAGLFGQTA
jgi:DNA-binding CsgD family transcriptional regulator